MNIKSNLIQLGLNEKEAKIYLASLELGTATISEISKKSNINRVTSYDIIDQLKIKGLISTTLKKKKKLYTAAGPDALQRIVESKQKILKDTLPFLIGLSNINIKKPKIQFFEGEQGMIGLYKKVLTAKKEVITFGDERHFYTLVLKKYFPDFRIQRVKKGIKAKLLIPNTKEGQITKDLDKFELRETKLFDPKDYKFNVYFLMFDNSTIIISPKDIIGLYIESKDITETLRSFVNLLWENLD